MYNEKYAIYFPQDGKISGCEKCGLCIFRTASGIMAAVDFAMLIWV